MQITQTDVESFNNLRGYTNSLHEGELLWFLSQNNN